MVGLLVVVLFDQMTFVLCQSKSIATDFLMSDLVAVLLCPKPLVKTLRDNLHILEISNIFWSLSIFDGSHF